MDSHVQGEYHANNQTMAKLLHKAIGLGKGSEANPASYAAYQVRLSFVCIRVCRSVCFCVACVLCLMCMVQANFTYVSECLWL